MLEFCEVCHNLLYITVNNDKLVKECKNCDNTIENDTTSMKIIETKRTLYSSYLLFYYLICSF